MSAIEPDRLKQQTEKIVKSFDSPVKFSLELKHLFEYYADRSIQSEETEIEHTILPGYNLPHQIINQIRTDLHKDIMNNPLAAFKLVETLWGQSIHESQILATYILGTISYDLSASKEKILHKQFKQLLHECRNLTKDATIIQGLASNSLQNLIKNKPELLLDQISTWVISKEIKDISFGLMSLTTLIDYPPYENLPSVFKIINPLVQQPDRKYRDELLTVIKACAARSKSETTSFLLKVAEETDSKTFKWIIRRSLSQFPYEYATRLKTLLR